MRLENMKPKKKYLSNLLLKIRFIHFNDLLSLETFGNSKMHDFLWIMSMIEASRHNHINVKFTIQQCIDLT